MTPIKILLVEDQQIIAKDLEGLLTDWGYQVIGIAASGHEAIDFFKNHQPDLALVDVNIEGNIDGIQTVEQFNQIRPIPIVYLTAQADFDTVQRAKSSNPFAYLLKPFDERGLQISLEMAFNVFAKHQIHPSKTEDSNITQANEIKLSADVILQNEDSIFIKQNYRFVKLKKEEIMLIEADRNHSYIHTHQHRYIVRMPLATIIERLQIDDLVRIHRSFAINIRFVEEFNDSEIIINGKNIPFTAAYKDEFLRHFNVI